MASEIVDRGPAVASECERDAAPRGAVILEFPTSMVRRPQQETSDERMLRMAKKLAEALGNSPDQVAAMMVKAERKLRADRVDRLVEVIQTSVAQVQREGKIDRTGLSGHECKKLDLAEIIAARVARQLEPA